jgi:hypothetical protein
MELRDVKDWGRGVRNASSVTVDGWIGGHDPPRFASELLGRYGYRLLPVCCPDTAAQDLRRHNLHRGWPPAR